MDQSVNPARRALPYEAAAFLGSFLLFQLELLSAKLLLPSFGGAAYVWTGCMMFFQGALFCGYLYARAALARSAAPRYARWHLLLLLIPPLFFPISLGLASVPDHPLARLLGALALSIGVPFFVLSTTSPVIQNWLEADGLEKPGESYLLYAASNAGAVSALLSYPVCFEPWMTLKTQLLVWEILYGAYAALHLFCLPGKGGPEAVAEAKGDCRSAILWLLLSMGPSASMLAVTNLLALDLAAVPLLWIAPLAVYLSTFILCFKRRPWYPERLSLSAVYFMLAWLGAVLLTVCFSADFGGGWDLLRRLWVVNKLVFLCASLFAVCLICHRALSLSRPRAELAPRFYLWIAAGGWLGSVLIGVLMPWLGRRTAMPELDWVFAGAISLGALVFKDRRGLRIPPGATALCAGIVVMSLGFGFYVTRSKAFSGSRRVSLRNFYGYYTVIDSEGLRKFYHGNTLHGIEYLDAGRRDVPLLYYDRHSPLGELFGRFGGSLSSVGVVGLGAGTIAAYGRPGERIDFYELDPDVEAIAREDFSYLRLSRARVGVVTGDARLSLQARPGERYDLLVLDAFSGGAVPMHLLTREAFELYLRRLHPGGLIAVHITNRFLNFRPVLAAVAPGLGLYGAAKAVDPREAIREERYYSSWVVLSLDAGKIKVLEEDGWRDLRRFDKGIRPWTDQYASLWPALGP